MLTFGRTLALLPLFGVAPLTLAANFAEIEPNSQKTTANAVTLACGDTISGTTTGATTGATSALGSADYFRIKTAAAPPAIYQNKLTLFTTAGFGHTASLRGLTQTGGAINAGTDATMQAGGLANSPPRVITQWYGFGKSEEVYYRVTGSSSTTAAYSAQLTCTTITPTSGPVLVAGNITITTAGQGHTTNTDLWVYDSNFNAIAGYGNDNDLAGGVTQSTLTRSFAAGTYYLAVSVANLANNLPSNGADEGSPSGNVLDFADAVAGNSLSFPTNCSVSFDDAAGSNPVALATALGFDVLWVQFTVQDGGACCVGATCGMNLATGCAAANGLFLGVGTACGAPPCPVFEVEPNDAKETAALVDFTTITAVSGITTGSSTTTTGAGSADYWQIKTFAAPGGAVWRHRLSVQSATSGHTLTLRGLTQSGGVISPGTDTALQVSSATTTPPNFVQWYGFGDQESVYCRVTGTASTTAPYVLTLESEPVSSSLYAGEFVEGTLTISTAGQGHTSDTDLWVYDTNLNPIPDFGNDDAFGLPILQSTLRRNFAPGFYFVAISNFNLANALASPTDDDFRSGVVTDFGSVLVNSSATAPVDLSIALTDVLGTHQLAITKTDPYQVVWLYLIVRPNGACCVANACTQQIAANCAAAGGYYYGQGAACPAGGCPLIETEPNNTKATAMAVALDCGDSIGGFTTGTSTVSAGLGSADYYKITTAAAPLGIYRHRLLYATDNLLNFHQCTLRGLTQTAGAINAGTDTIAQFASGLTNPTRFCQWYGFGKQEQVYYRVTGSASTNTNYTALLECVPVTPIEGPSLLPGIITIARAGHANDADLWIYDANLVPLGGYGNDEPNTLTRGYLAGTYYLAISDANLANNQASNMADESMRTGVALDFPDAVINSSTTANVDMSVIFTDAAGSQIVAATKTGAFDVVWIRFEANGPGGCCVSSGCSTMFGPACATAGGVYMGDNNPCIGAACPEVEPNDSKVNATAVTLACGASIAGTSTGISTSIPGLGSADYFRIQTTPAPQGIYRYRLNITNNQCNTCTTLRGLQQSGGNVVAGSDATVQNSSILSSPPYAVNWYGFGRAEQMYFRVTGASTNAAGYTATLSCETITPLTGPALRSGAVTITTVGQGHSTDTDMWVYDSTLHAMADIGNDDTSAAVKQSTATASFTPGTYYLALSKDNFANGEASDQPSEFDRAGAVLDSPDAALVGLGLLGVGNLSVSFNDASGAHPVAASADSFEVVWIRFTVDDFGACCAANGTCGETFAANCAAAGGTFRGAGTLCASANCTPACLAGDANCDGAVNNFDIDAFVQGVLAPADPVPPPVYLAIGGTQACWDQRGCWGDVNHDLAFNNFDIDAFVACIISPPLPGHGCP